MYKYYASDSYFWNEGCTVQYFFTSYNVEKFPIWLLLACVLIFYGCIILSYMDNHNLFNKHALQIFLLFPFLLCVPIKSDVHIPSQYCTLHNGLLFFFDVLLCNYFRAKLFFWVWVCPWNSCVGNFVLCHMLMTGVRPLGGDWIMRAQPFWMEQLIHGLRESWDNDRVN